MLETYAFALSILALVVAILTAWFSLFYRGKVRMTLPSMVAFGYDDRGGNDGFNAKVMIRCLVFSTGERGQVIETLFAELHGENSDNTFTVWGIDTDTKLVRGGGLWVGKTGVTAWHHFVASNDFQFEADAYTVEIFARVHGSKDPIRLQTLALSLPTEHAPTRHDGTEQVWFDREPQSGDFRPRLEAQPRPTSY